MKKGLRAAKTSWRAALWPPLLYTFSDGSFENSPWGNPKPTESNLPNFFEGNVN